MATQSQFVWVSNANPKTKAKRYEQQDIRKKKKIWLIGDIPESFVFWIFEWTTTMSNQRTHTQVSYRNTFFILKRDKKSKILIKLVKWSGLNFEESLNNNNRSNTTIYYLNLTRNPIQNGVDNLNIFIVLEIIWFRSGFYGLHSTLCGDQVVVNENLEYGRL